MVAADPSPSPSGRSMRIEVGGRMLTVRSDAPEARVQAVVQFLNERLDRIRGQSSMVNADQVVLLAALNMAEELFALRERHETLKARVQDRGQQLLATLDQMAREPLPEHERDST